VVNTRARYPGCDAKIARARVLTGALAVTSIAALVGSYVTSDKAEKY
jgi:hypothetical protein